MIFVLEYGSNNITFLEKRAINFSRVWFQSAIASLRFLKLIGFKEHPLYFISQAVTHAV